MMEAKYRGRFQPQVPESKIRLLLSGYRVFAFVIVAIQALFLTYPPFPHLPAFILVGMVGAYTVLKVLYPFRWYQRDTLTYTVLGADLILCAFLPCVTGGLHSAFLLYSLCPLLTIALIFPRRFTFSVAGFLSLSILASEVVTMNFFSSTLVYSHQYSLPLLAIYVMLCGLCSWLPYITNANVSSGIKYSAIVEERSRLSREMHDSLAQTLSSLNWKADLLWQSLADGETYQAMSQAADMKKVVQTAHREVRESIDLLRQKTVERLGLIPTLVDYVHEFTKTTGIRCQLYLANGQVELPPLAEVQLLRIAQEALTNVRKHAVASKAEVRFESFSNHVEMTIRDDGPGFDLVSYHARSLPTIHTHGLAVMRERAESLGGRLAITTCPGSGTEIKVKLPIEAIKWLY